MIFFYAQLQSDGFYTIINAEEEENITLTLMIDA